MRQKNQQQRINKYFIIVFPQVQSLLISILFREYYYSSNNNSQPMNFDNLFAVQCNIRYDQNKLQSILKTFEQRMKHMELQITAIDRRCEHLQLSDITSDEHFGKFQSFTIDNLRSSVDKFSSLNSNVSKYLGKDSCQYEKEDGTIIPTDPKKEFEDKVVQYSKQAQEIANQKLVKTQLSFVGSFLNKQSSKIQTKVAQKQMQFDLIADQVKKLINQKFEEYKQELTTKGRKIQFNNEFQKNSNKHVGGKRPSVANKLFQIQNEKDSFEHQNASEMRPSMLDLLAGEGVSDMSNKNFGKLQSNMEFQDVKNDDDILSKKNKKLSPKPSFQGEKFKEEISRIKETLNKGFLENSTPRNQLQLIYKNQDRIKQAESLSASAVQALTSKIKQQMHEILKKQVSKMSEKNSEMMSKYELSDINMTFMMKEFKHYKDDLEKLFNKSAEIDQKMENLTSENDEKLINLAGKIREHELKINQMEISSLNGQNSFRDQDSGRQNSADVRKFKEISNFKKTSQFDPISVSLNTSSNMKIIHTKNSSSVPFTTQGPIINKINLLSQKIHKIQEKLKNSTIHPSEKNLPKIEPVASSSRNINGSLMEQLRKDLLKTNEQIAKTNDKVQTVKKSLHQLETAHHLIPKQIQKLQMDLHEINEIQQNRLIDMIKDIINRVLTDPFNNNFTNILKRQINSKFLQIKHEYASIMKDIESRVMDRADVGELVKLKDFVQTNSLQLKTLMQKKADNEDFKKGIKYLDQKLKELYSYVKDMQEEEQLTNTRPQTQSTAYTRTGFLRSKKQP